MKYHVWDQEQIDYLCENANGNTSKNLTRQFNERFDTNLKVGAIRSQLYARGIKFNTHISRYSKGRKSFNTLPIGSKSVDKDGYIIYKHSVDGGHYRKNWKLYHHHLWEQAYGDIPKGHIVVFLNGNNRDFRLDNLYCIPRAAWIKAYKEDMISDDPEMLKTTLILNKLILKQRGLTK
ncbi:HNH endonuclease signature motif containing protein [Staphylococcus chromogenes]|uniref:HNH endonuclease signature motif containing protein n=1 Tax=Staphylococcus chromogenes TaxID=46126 RepID=UPI00288358EF|nr:HNH endonuclease signature motif containing protein [Staphylococcus chromogenes]MDT0679661.1 HNH endonuclease signature motif containing protein [Staphylococcus chromogenes]